jgi:predicted lipoprotein
MTLLALTGAACAMEPGSMIMPIQMLHQNWSVPKASDFVRDGAGLKPALQAVCDAPQEKSGEALAQAKQQWLMALSSWEKLSAVSTGPPIERRSQRQIDFMPTRPRMIEAAIKSSPASLADLELIGTPAKGLPALEWLLWVSPIQPASAECRYAVLISEEIEREARALNEAYRKAASQKPGEEAAKAALSELVNQWVGGIERLRWANMEMPVRVAMTSRKKTEPDFPRHSAEATEISWAAQWEALRTLAAGSGLSLEAALREKNQDKLAGTLASVTLNTDKAMQGLRIADRSRLLDAARELAALKRLVEDKVAPALGVTIGFSDADGD